VQGKICKWLDKFTAKASINLCSMAERKTDLHEGASEWQEYRQNNLAFKQDNSLPCGRWLKNQLILSFGGCRGKFASGRTSLQQKHQSTCAAWQKEKQDLCHCTSSKKQQKNLTLFRWNWQGRMQVKNNNKNKQSHQCQENSARKNYEKAIFMQAHKWQKWGEVDK